MKIKKFIDINNLLTVLVNLLDMVICQVISGMCIDI